MCNLKGGTGKTTSAIFLATALTRKDCRVRVLDGDPQGSATDWAILAEDAGAPLPFLVEPANARSITRLTKDSDEWVIIDCPPGDTRIIDAALQMVDLIIVPTRPSTIEVERMWTTVELSNTVPVTVLLTSVIANTKSLEALREALSESGVNYFTVGIPQREAIKNNYGEVVGENLHGYAAVAKQLLQEWKGER